MMIPRNDFIALVREAIPRFRQHPPNGRQEACLLAPSDVPLMIVAGPGSGKTTALVLRALRFVSVDGLLPENILITTFTRKAADEIRARLIEWGLLLVNYLRSNPPIPKPSGFSEWLDSIDVNRFLTGTLDSICEETLTRYRDPAAPSPVVIEGFVGNACLARDGLFPAKINQNKDVTKYLTPFNFEGKEPRNFGERLQICRLLADRFVNDQVAVSSFCADPGHSGARTCLANALQTYWASLSNSHRLDFALLERTFLDRLAQGRLARFVNCMRAVLVDEYQDTNPLQENIYFEMVRQAGASFSVVGDDDQSLYRFRGATIELFRDFVSRYQAVMPSSPTPHVEYLVENYRSTPEIIQFFNDFISTDPAYSPARVQPPKPRIVAQLPSVNIPVMGLFRPTVDDLADDLCDFLFDVFRGHGRMIQSGGQQVRLISDPNGGDFGDAVFLAHTVNEYARAYGSNPPRPRLPLLLRERFEARGGGVFNPRGRALRDIFVVQKLLGTVLDCIDPPSHGQPYGVQQGEMNSLHHLRREAVRYFTKWREVARGYFAQNPQPNSPQTINDFVQAWQTRRPQGKMHTWPDEWPILELCFKLLSWLPFLRDDPEGQVYLEAVSRAISQAASFSSYRSNIVFGDPLHEPQSIRHAISDILAPIAENDVEVDEDIMPSVPRDRFNLMTIHQAKGLEYPLVIIDVGSDYSRDQWTQRFRRFPENPSNVTVMEDDLANHCAIGPLRIARYAIDRTFDDLVRLYYVAYSRGERVMLLIGRNPMLRYRTNIKHVATGWRRDRTWSWRKPVSGKNPPLANNIPIQLL